LSLVEAFDESDVLCRDGLFFEDVPKSSMFDGIERLLEVDQREPKREIVFVRLLN
jgi:hypothetical protein